MPHSSLVFREISSRNKKYLGTRVWPGSPHSLGDCWEFREALLGMGEELVGEGSLIHMGEGRNKAGCLLHAMCFADCVHKEGL